MPFGPVNIVCSLHIYIRILLRRGEIETTPAVIIQKYLFFTNTSAAPAAQTYFDREEAMAKKLYVGNLSYNTHDEDLREAFSKFGEVLSVTLIVDQATGRSKGFGFVEMTSDEDAQKAISAMNGANFMERTITVNEARPKTEGGRGRSGFGGGGGGGRGNRGGGYGGGGRSWR
jgi:RNA recognition motif-containing protein